MPSKNLRAGVKGRAGKHNVIIRGTRGRTFAGIVAVRTNATTGDIKIRSGAHKPLVSGATQNTTHKSKTASTFEQRH